MYWWHPDNFIKKQQNLLSRAQIIKNIRRFFDDQDFFEVETPILQVCPVMDTHIHGFKTNLLNIDRSVKKDMYLHTSPEFDMKKILTAGVPRIYQICHVFRNAEGSKLHSPEFTMIEWYRAHADYTAMMDDCENLIRALAIQSGRQYLNFRDHQCDPFKDWERLSVADAFTQYTKINLDDCLNDLQLFKAKAQGQGIRVIDSDQWDDVFHAVMAEKIEPFLGMNQPTILYDYPVSMAALSRKKPSDTRYAERFELYICGVELANAFSELTDAKEQRKRYQEEKASKQKIYGESYPPDESFFAALEYGMPDSAGIALGIDRLVMLLLGVEDINHVLWAPVEGH